MARKIPVKLIMELREQGLSRNMIAKTKRVGRDSVSEVFRRADELDLTYADIQNISEQEVYQKLFPSKHQSEALYTLPDYDYVQEELKRVGVTLKLLWTEYVDECKKQKSIAVGYSKFCEDYNKHIDQYKLTNHLKHKPGVSTQVDWAGATMQLLDPESGAFIEVHLFVAVLPYSQYTYVEGTLDMTSDTWIRCHVNLFNFLGGTTIRLISDNLKTGVISHPKEGDIILNAQYEGLADHYVMAIMPTGVKKPKQKAAVEGGVNQTAMAVIAPLRNEIFTRLDELNDAIMTRITLFNATPFQKREGSRKQIFETVEHPTLRPLPLVPYEVAEWVYGRKVKLDCHITFQKNNYSCPYQYVRKQVDLRVTDRLLEVYYNQERIATHKRFPSYLEYQFSTSPEHLPEQFNRPQVNDTLLLNQARAIGPFTHKVIQRVFETVPLKERGYQPSQSILKLSQFFSNEDLETACHIALERIHSPRYRHLYAILTNPVQAQSEENHKPEPPMGFVRGAAYYGGEDHD